MPEPPGVHHHMPSVRRMTEPWTATRASAEDDRPGAVARPRVVPVFVPPEELPVDGGPNPPPARFPAPVRSGRCARRERTALSVLLPTATVHEAGGAELTVPGCFSQAATLGHPSRKVPHWTCGPAVCRVMTPGPPPVRVNALDEWRHQGLRRQPVAVGLAAWGVAAIITGHSHPPVAGAPSWGTLASQGQHRFSRHGRSRADGWS